MFILLTVTAKLRYGTGSVDVALYELISAIEAAQFRSDFGPGVATGGASTPSGKDSPSPLPPHAPSLPGRPPRPQPHAPPKRGSHVE